MSQIARDKDTDSQRQLHRYSETKKQIVMDKVTESREIKTQIVRDNDTDIQRQSHRYSETKVQIFRDKATSIQRQRPM